MVQGLSAITLATSSGGLSVSAPFLRRHFGLVKENHMDFGVKRQRLWHQFGQSLSLQSYAPGCRNVRVEAGWPFRGSYQGKDARSERSENAIEDILIFSLQLELATRLQSAAMNLKQNEIAKLLKGKLKEVEKDIIRQRKARLELASKRKDLDMAVSILYLRVDLQNAVENENYTLAAELRDQISKLETDCLVASVWAQAHAETGYKFRLGLKVRHKMFGYRGVICGMDPFCCESKSWMETAGVNKLARGPDQPFYQVLVDVDQYPDLLVAYVAEENLLAPDKPDRDRFDHPYISFLFDGVDFVGNFMPIKQLWKKYHPVLRF